MSPLPSVETVHGGQESDDSTVTASVDGWLSHFKEVGIMGSLTSRWLRKNRAAGVIPLLLAQVSVALVCVPQTLTAGTDEHHKVIWEALPVLLNGEEKVTIRISGGAVRGDVVSVQQKGIHIQRITMATDSTRYPGGSKALIPRDAVKEIRFETRQKK